MWHRPLRITTPLANINDNLILSKHQQDILTNNYLSFVGKNYQAELISDRGRIGQDFSVDFFNHCFVYLITETVADYPYPYFTEKTWKAIVSKTPFMLVGAPKSLQKLQEFGFKTFNQWWCEDYDTLVTGAQRIEAIVQELLKLAQLSQSRLVELRQNMQSTVEYNYAQLSKFVTADLDNVEQSLYNSNT